jgi:hypothetical protein
MMKYVLLALLLALFVTACTNSNGPSDITDPFVGGTAGLALSFEQGAPPAEIYDGGQMPFSVFVRVENLGEADVGPDSVNGVTGDNTFALIQIIGINPAQFGYPEVEKTFAETETTILGARKNFDGTIIAGTLDSIPFEGYEYLPDEQGNSQVTMRANICYDYTTRTNTRVCIKDNLLENVQDDSICVLSGPKDVKNSGAPVHVTAVTQNPLGRDKIQVTFTVENVGSGQVFRRASEQQYSNRDPYSSPCDNSITNPNRNQVKVRVNLGDDTASGLIRCPLLDNSNEGYINLFQGNAATISCTIQTDPQGNRIYTDSMRISLEYTYSQFVETPILIRDVSAGSPDPRT